ncbi:MAG: hypothetical protein ACFFCI_02225 [Promethearchaeota archaeon]
MYQLQFDAFLPMYILAIGMTGLVIIYYFFNIRPERITEGVTPSLWRKITPELPKVYGIIHFRILNPKTGSEINFEGGDIFEYSSDTTDEVHIVEEDMPNPKLLTNGAFQEEAEALDKELGEDLPFQKQAKSFTPFLPIPSLEKRRVIVQKKSSTYVCLVRNKLMPHEGQILAFRVHNLMSGQDMTSKMRKLKVITFAPGKSKIHNFIIGILLLYNFVLTSALLQNRPADFIFEPVMYGWYFSIALLLAFQKYLDWTQWGFWSVFRIERISKDVEFSFFGGSDFEIRLDVYDIVPHYYPGITLGECFKVDPEEIAVKLNNFTEMKLKKAISRIISMAKDIRFMDNVIADLRKLTDQQNEKIQIARAEGYTLGRNDNDISPILGQPIFSSGLLGNLGGPLKILIIVAGLVICVLGIINFLDGFTLGWIDKVLIGVIFVVIGIFAILIMWRAPRL